MKKCPRCKTVKEDSEFHRNPTTGKLASYCNPCKRLWERERRAAHKEEYNARARDWRHSNWESHRAAQYKWRKANPEKWKANYERWSNGNRLDYEAGRRAQVRVEVFEAYGGFKCACCGESGPMFLTIDHVNNDGNKHRKELATKIGRGGTAFFDWLKRNKFPAGYQVLCRNCNWGKHANGGVCPHRNPEGSTTKGGSPVELSGSKREGSRKRS